jgi:hypothetical protein
MPRELIEPHKDDKRYVRRKKGKFSTRQTEVDRCRNHVNKQQAGILSFAMRVVTDPGGLLDPYLTVRQGSEEWNTARVQLEQARQTVPVEWHKQRMSALYSDNSACVCSRCRE